MKKIFYIVLVSLFIANISQAQCGDSEVCNGNTGLYSNDDATSIAYDNMGSGFHSTYIREPNGGWRLWGEHMNKNGSTNNLSPLNVNVTNYPALTGTIYKMGLGSDYIDHVQLIVLTSTGLFVLGNEGAVVSTSFTTSSSFQKIVVDGKADGLPINVTPADVKMMFTSTATIIITTCLGEVYVLSQNDSIRGAGGLGDELHWSKVMVNASQSLTDIIVARGNSEIGYALKSNGTLWTWGDNCFLGNGSPSVNLVYATPMTLPAGLPGIKMIQATQDYYNLFDATSSYYILGTDKKIYSLGINNDGQLGDRTSTDRYSWVNVKNPNNTIITDAAWISANEHDHNFAGLAIIKAGGVLYTAGTNDSYMIGRTLDGDVNYPSLPTGVSSSDVITQAETGGHTCALIKLGSPRYGYVGHRINGSMGDGSSNTTVVSTYDFITPPIVFVCGTLCVTPVLTSNSPICPGQNAVFTITGTAGDIVSYKINNGNTQTVVIGAAGTVSVTIPSALTDQSLALVYVLGGTGACSNNLSTEAIVTVGGNVAPFFVQVPSICVGQPLNPLPTTSNNGIDGTWSPALDNTVTTTYTFTPSISGSCLSTATMTIVVTPSGTIPTFTIPTSICEGTVLQPLPTTSNEGITGSWSPALNNTTTTNYTFTPDAGTCINSVQATIDVTPKPTPTFTQVDPICVGGVINPLPTSSTNSTSITGTWSPAIDNLHTTTYTFTPTAGLCANSAFMTIVVNPMTDPTFTQVDPICIGDTLNPLPTTSNNGFSGSWSPAISNLATTTYTFTPSTGVCANTAQMTIVVKQKANPTFASVNPICYGDSLFNLPLVSNNTIPIAGTWLPAINNTQTTQYTFTPVSTACANTTTMQIQVYDDFDFTDKRYCQNDEFYLQVSPLNQSYDDNTASYTWQLNNQTVSTNAIFNVTAYLNSTTVVEQLPLLFTIKVTNANGCDKIKNVLVDNDFCGIQKGVSANNDDLNDFFDLRLLNVKHLSIFNRYGMKVYSKANYLKEWKGQTDGGTQLPDGTYYYVIDFNDSQQASKTGWIYLNTEQ